MQASLDEPVPAFETVAGRYDGKRFNSPNDLVQHSSGAIYFTDPPYGLEEGTKDPGRELPYQGVFRVEKDGEVTLLVDSLSRPNGLAFSPDEQTLYVANSDPDKAVWMAYEVNTDGTLSNGRIFYDATDKVDEERGLPDGLKVDPEGYIYATGPGGLWIFKSGGNVMGRIKTGIPTSNCAIGNNGSMLYMTADSLLLGMPLK
jgi:gluconolactonase